MGIIRRRKLLQITFIDTICEKVFVDSPFVHPSIHENICDLIVANILQYSSIWTWLFHACDKCTTLHIFQITRCVHACSRKIDDVWMLVKSIMSTRKCTRRAIFCRVYLLKHAHEWLSRETLEYCSANYHATVFTCAVHWTRTC